MKHFVRSKLQKVRSIIDKRAAFLVAHVRNILNNPPLNKQVYESKFAHQTARIYIILAFHFHLAVPIEKEN